MDKDLIFLQKRREIEIFFAVFRSNSRPFADVTF